MKTAPKNHPSKDGPVIDRQELFKRIAAIIPVTKNDTDKAANLNLETKTLAEQSGCTKCLALNSIVEGWIKYYRASSLDAEISANQALKIAEENDLAVVRAYGYDLKAAVERDKGNYNNALRLYHLGLKSLEEDPEHIPVVSLLSGIGIILQRQGRNDQSIKYFNQALDYAKRLKQKEGPVLNNLAISYKNLGMYEKAIELYNQVIDLYKVNKDYAGLTLAYMNLAVVYGQKSDYTLTRKYLQMAIEAGKNSGSNKRTQSIYINLASVERLDGNTEMAIHYALKGLQSERADSTPRLHLENILVLADCCLDEGSIEEALLYFNSARKIGEQLGEDPKLEYVYGRIADIHARKGDFKQAHHYRSVQNKFISELREQSKVYDIIKEEMNELERALEEMTEKNKYQGLLLEKSREIEMQNEDLRQFAYAAAHDISEPLRMIGSFTQLLLKRLDGKLDERSLEYAEHIKSGTSRLHTLLSDLLKYTNIERLQDEWKDVDLNKTLEDLRKDLKLKIDETGAKIEYLTLPVVYGLPSYVKLLFQNLLTNAIKFRKENVDPVISIDHRDLGNRWEINVRDNGIGIREQDTKKIFTLFKRLHSTEEYEGTGIGLAICKKIMNKMDGEIGIESTYGEGTVFRLYIPKKSIDN